MDLRDDTVFDLEMQHPLGEADGQPVWYDQMSSDVWDARRGIMATHRSKWGQN